MEENHIDPYAPPTSTPNQNSNTTYLTEDGYVFQNQLVANQYFKSPLICAKLGIPIPPESNPTPLEITVTRIPRVSGFLNYIISVLSFFILIIIIVAVDFEFAAMMIIAYLAISLFTRFYLARPYKIPFYLSEQHTRIRKKRIFIFSAILIILAGLLIYGIASQHPGAIVFSIFGNIITFILFRFKSTDFTVTETKGDYHYIRGVHQGLLNALPHLPFSS